MLAKFANQSNRQGQYTARGFSFWFKRGKNYSIVFVDPKGAQNIGGYAYKLDGYADLFKDESSVKTFTHNGFDVKVFVFLFNKNIPPDVISPGYWSDRMDDVIDKIL